MSCWPYRHHDPTDDLEPAEEHATPHPGDTGSLLERPISRAHLLQAMGGGLAATLTAASAGWDMAQGASGSLPYVVLIVLDGARNEYFDIPGIPHVHNLIRNGTRYTNAFAGILESETPSGHVTIGTGTEPRKSGIPSFWWATRENVAMDIFSPTKIRAGALEKLIRQSGVPTLAGLVRAKHRRAGVVALSGSKYYAADAIGGPDADVIMYYQSTPDGKFVPTYIPGHAPPSGVLNGRGVSAKTTHVLHGLENHLAMRLAADTFHRMRQHVTLINLPEFDWPLGHVYGATRDPNEIKTLMHRFDSDLAMLRDVYRKAGVLNRTVFVLMADHGMMPLTHTVPFSDITGAVSRAGGQILSEAHTSGFYIWLKDEAYALASARSIARLGNPYIQSVYVRRRTSKGTAYSRVTSSKLMRDDGTEGANQYLLNSFNGPNGPDVVVAFMEGVGCEPGGQAKWKGDHGGTSWEAQHIPLILSGPGINAGHASSYPARLIDVAPTVLQVMGITQQRMQGIPLADALKSPPGWAVQWQRAWSKRLLPVATALQRESHAELAAGR